MSLEKEKFEMWKIKNIYQTKIKIWNKMYFQEFCLVKKALKNKRNF